MEKATDISCPVINHALCTACGTCIEVCPHSAIVKTPGQACEKCIKYCFGMDVDCKPHFLVLCCEKCDACGKCVDACPHDAISLKH